MFAAHNTMMIGNSKVNIKGTGQSSTSSITLPTHAAGDLIIVWCNGSALPVAPAASGTVPAWYTIHSQSNVNRPILVAYTIATANNHTSGTFSNTSSMFVAVMSGQSYKVPIGGNALSFNGQVTNPTAPAVTLTNKIGGSQILHAFITSLNPTWGTAPANYTLLEDSTNLYARLFAKNVTTSDGTVQHPTSVAKYFGTSSVEVPSASINLLPSIISDTAYVSTSQSTTSTTYTDLTTVTDTVTVNIGPTGTALVLLQVGLTNTTSSSGPPTTFMSYDISGATTKAASDDFAIRGWNVKSHTGMIFLETGLSQGATTFKLKYRISINTYTATFLRRRIMVVPL